MQTTNNTTTVQLDENKLLNLIIDQRIVKLERIFEKMYNLQFTKLSTNAFNSHLYLCLVELGLKAGEITDVYDVGEAEFTRIVKACHTKMQTNKAYQMYLYKIHLNYLKNKIAA